MAGAEIAFVAAAGAAGLAVSVSAWAWRLRRRLTHRHASMSARLTEGEARDASRAGALAAFQDVRIALTASPPWSVEAVHGAPESIEAAEQVLFGPAPEGESPANRADLIAGLTAAAPGLSGQISALAERGEAFDTSVVTPEGGLIVQGRVWGGSAWLKLSPSGRTGAATEVAGLSQSLLDLSPGPIWVLDASGALSWANQAWLREVGAPDLGEARARGLTFDRGADTLAQETARIGARQEGFRWIAQGERRRAWRIITEPLNPKDGDGAVVVFAIDVTEEEETRDALRRHVAGHDETLNHLADAVAIFGPSQRLAFHNTALQTLFHLDPAWLDERPTHGELLDRLRQRRLLPETMDYPGWRARELAFYGASQAAPDDSWSLPDGRTLRVVRQPHPLGGVLLLFSDITGELELRSRYNSQIQVQTATLDKLNDAVAVFGSDGRLRLHNEAFESFWNLGRDQLEEAADFEAVAALCQATLPDPALWLELKARVADPDPESRVAVSGEGRASDGRIAAWQTRPLPDGATLVAFSDVTARRELEQALAAKEAALAESQALKREFVGSVSYELRTPLTTIVGYSELMESQGAGLSERSRQHAGAIRIAASQLARSIDDVLDMAQIDAGEMQLSLGDVRLGDILAGGAEEARARIEGRGASLKLDWPADLKPIRGDERRISQALGHLLDNATRAVGEGGVVTLAAERGANEVRIRVSDTGRGIPYHLQAHVFDRFVRRDRGGPGVGLALVKALVELHGGWAEVESEPGRGATFILHLPEQSVPDAAQPELKLA